MTDYQTLHVQCGAYSITLPIHVRGGKVFLPFPRVQHGPWDLRIDSSDDAVDADYAVKNAFPAITLTPDQIEDIPPSWPEDDIRMDEELIAIGKRLALDRKKALPEDNEGY